METEDLVWLIISIALTVWIPFSIGSVVWMFLESWRDSRRDNWANRIFHQIASCGNGVNVDRAIFCKRCRTPHHLDCWEFNLRCSTYACGETKYVRKY